MITSDSAFTPATKLDFARWRKPTSRVIGAVFLAFLVLTDSQPSPLLELTSDVMGIVLVSAAVLGRIWCALYIAGRKNVELCIDGPYSFCRNPLYLFSFLGAFGFVIMAGVLPLGIILGPLFWGYHHFVIQAEEANLRSLFGAAYADYCAKVPRILPFPWLYWSRSHLMIDPRLMLRAFSEVVWFLVATAVAAVVERLRDAGLAGVSLPTLFVWPF